MSSPSNEQPDAENISLGHAIGDSLHGHTDPNLPSLRADAVKLTADEELLLGIFREHAGQALTPERLAELATGSRKAQGQGGRTLTESDIARLADSLGRKLSMLGPGERIREVSGVGYILWR